MQNRIEVIDALRAVTLLGILLTHTAQFFVFPIHITNKYI